MRAINHALTGAVIGMTVSEPWLAAPTAVLSHFVCDALPHFDADFTKVSKAQWIGSKTFRNLLVVDAILCAGLILVLAIREPQHWLVVALCAFLATLPDALWLNRFLKSRQGKPWRPNPLTKFSSDIQWFTKPIGLVVEAAWLVAGIVIILPFLR